jgi:hypothetical protein
MSDQLQHAFTKSFHLSSSSLNDFICAGITAGLIYHTRAGIAACQENLSDGAFGRRSFLPAYQLAIRNWQWAMTNRNRPPGRIGE